MIHVEKFNDLDKLEKRLNELALEPFDNSGDSRPQLLNIDTFATDEGWFATLIWRE